ncbi:MAG: alpha/beta hydrolase [Blastocatellia bacterium]
MRHRIPALLLFPIICLSAMAVYPQTGQAPASTNGREVPPRTIPVPGSVSPELQEQIARPIAPTLKYFQTTSPKGAEEWKQLIALMNGQAAQMLAQMKKAFPVRIESGTMAGVKVYTVTPDAIPAENRNRALVHLHGGAYVIWGGEIAAGEAILLAHYAKMKVISVDYRMPPDHPFPAAVDDAVAVWKEVIKTYKPGSVGLGGTSAGGGLTLAAAYRLKELKLPLPGAIFGGTTWADLTKTGDTVRTNEYLDNIIPTHDGLLDAAARLYAGKEDLRNPLISPVYGDFKRFPPAILVTGTRDLLLSDTVRVHRKLRQAGVEAQLHVFEGLSHAEYIGLFNAPESKDAWTEVASFFARHLGK